MTLSNVKILAKAYQRMLDAFVQQDQLDAATRDTAEYWDEVAEHGEFSERGATLSRADFEDARANL